MFVIVKTLSVVPIGGIPRENERGLRLTTSILNFRETSGIPRENERGFFMKKKKISVNFSGDIS